MNAKSGFCLIAVVGALLLLSACTDLQQGWDGAMTDIGLYGPPEQSPAMPAQTARPHMSNNTRAEMPPSWCQQIATQARQAAARNGFDAATQAFRYRASYTQCVEMFGHSSTP